MPETILLLDASPLIYQAYNTVGHFSTKAGVKTGVTYGFIRSLRSYTEKLSANRVAVCFDLPGAVQKAEGQDHYKSNREWSSDKDAMYAQVPLLRETLSFTRYTQIDAPGYEADDLIGLLARNYGANGHQVKIVSPDNDLCQLVRDNIRIWMPEKSKTKEKAWEKDPRWVQEHFGIDATLLLYLRAFMGDTSDNLPSLVEPKHQTAIANRLTRCGMSTNDPVAQITEEWESYLPLLRNFTIVDPEILKNTWLQNVKVMSLAHPPKEAVNIQKGARDVTKLRAQFQKMEMPSMDKFVENLCGVS